MKMDAGMDTGPMLLKGAIAIGENETFGELYSRMSKLGAKLIIDALDLLAEGRLEVEIEGDE